MHDCRARLQPFLSRHAIASLLATVLALVAMLAIAPPAQAAPDPVVRAINTAIIRKQIARPKGAELRRTWLASARAARTARTKSRRANIVAVRNFTLRLARSKGLTPDRLEPALLSVQATTHVMLKEKRYPSHEQELEIPGEVVVFTYYSGRGVQFQPFETLKQGMRELNQVEPDIEAARAIADRMLELDVRRGPAAIWEYYFPFGGPSHPWTSAISQALATEFFYRVAAAVPEGERAPYDEAAAAATASFVRSPRAGGVAVPSGKGRFYLMYPFATWQRILNGHLQVLLNVNRYANASGNQQARNVVTLGLRGVLGILPKFDTGAWSNYQPGQEAELGYHEFQTEQLQKLGKELEHPVLMEYGNRFAEYLETPPTLTFTADRWPSIMGARDGFRDRIIIRFGIDKRARVTIVIRDSELREVRRFSVWRGRGSGTLIWDGRDARRKLVPPGEYSASVTSTDVAGNRSVVDVPSPLVVERDTTPPEIRLVSSTEAGRGFSLVRVTAVDSGSGRVTVQLRIDGKVVATKRGPRGGTTAIRIRRSIADVRRGEVVVRDTSGNETVQPITTAGAAAVRHRR